MAVFLFYLALLVPPVAWAQGYQTNTLTGFVGDYGLTPPATNYGITITCMAPRQRVVNGVLVTDAPKVAYPATDGSFAFTNIQWGRYQLTVAGRVGTAWTLYVYTNDTGTIPIGSRLYPLGTVALPMPNPATNFYTMPQVDALVASVQGSSAGSVIQSTAGNGITITTNGQLFTISFTNAGGFISNNQAGVTLGSTTIGDGSYSPTPLLTVKGNISLPMPGTGISVPGVLSCYEFQMTQGSHYGYFLMSDGSGNGGWAPFPGIVNGQSGVTLAGSFSGDGSGTTNLLATNVVGAVVSTNAFTISGLGPNFVTYYVGQPGGTIDATGANGTYTLNADGVSASGPNGYGVINDFINGYTWITNVLNSDYSSGTAVGRLVNGNGYNWNRIAGPISDARIGQLYYTNALAAWASVPYPAFTNANGSLFLADGVSVKASSVVGLVSNSVPLTNFPELDVGTLTLTNPLPYGALPGLTTNVAVMVPNSLTNWLCFSNGLLWGIVVTNPAGGGGGGGGGTWVYTQPQSYMTNLDSAAASNVVIAEHVTLSAGTVISLSVYVGSAGSGDNLKIGLYDPSGNLVASGNASVATSGYALVSVPSTVISGGDCVVACIPQNGGQLRLGLCATGTNYYIVGSAYTLPSTETAWSSSAGSSYSFGVQMQ